VRRRADYLIATDEVRFERMGKHRDKTFIIENFPEDPGAELSRNYPTGPIKIYVGGTLNLRRGLEQIIGAVERTPDFEIISAGWLFDDYASNVFARHPRVTFNYNVSARASLELAASCDAVFMFYEPTSRNNILASPNKIHDALCVGRPVIVNSEILPSSSVSTLETGWVCGYDDPEGLAKIMTALREARGSIAERATRLRRVFETGHSWSVMERRLATLYETLAA
jgi:glycosyltransferase involved in cell wall biosynthesis